MGIYDREYYREDDRSSNPFSRVQGTVFLCVLFIGMFLAQQATTDGPGRGAGHPGLTGRLELKAGTVLEGDLWRLLSYALVHQPGKILHPIFTVLFLIWIGRQVEDLYGSREYLAYFTVASLLGGVGYTLVAVASGVQAPLLGPSGAVTAVLILFALHYPHVRLFIFPIWLVVAVYALVDIVSLAGDRANPAAVAVHLFGAVFAFVYHSYSLRVLNWIPFRRGTSSGGRRTPRTAPRPRAQAPEPEPAAAASVTGAASGKLMSVGSAVDEHLEAKLDEVLAKVQQHGKESLTEGEREVLLRASEIYKRRRQSG